MGAQGGCRKKWQGAKPYTYVHFALEQALAVDPSGTGFVVYQDRLDYKLVCNRFDPVNGWSLLPETVYENPGKFLISDLRAASDDDGNILVVFHRLPDPGQKVCYEVYAIRYEPVTGWSDPLCIGFAYRYTMYSAYAEGLVMDVADSGEAAVIWSDYGKREYGFSHSRIFSARYDPDSGWSPQEQMYEVSPGSVYATGHFLPDISMNDNGDAFASFVDTSNSEGNAQVMVVSSENGGPWSTPAAAAQLNNEIPEAPGKPGIRTDKDGNAMLMYLAREGVFSLASKKGAGWGNPLNVSPRDNSEYSMGFVFGFDMNKQGQAAAVWTEENPSRSIQDMFGSSYNPASDNWNAPVRIEQSLFHPQHVQVKTGPSGVAIAVWHATIPENPPSEPSTLPFVAVCRPDSGWSEQERPNGL
jgi:hypothetical protein